MECQAKDSELVADVLAGHKDRYAELVQRHRETLYTICLHYVGNPADAEDMTQQTFLEAFDALARFDGRGRFSSWLVRIGVNNCKDFLKSHMRHEQPREEPELYASVAGMFSGKIHTPRGLLMGADRDKFLREALDRLEPKYREPLVLKDLEQLGYQEIQARLGINLRTLKSRVLRGRVKLRKSLLWVTRQEKP